MKKLFAMLMSISLIASLIPSAMAATDINDGLVGHWTFDTAKTALYSEVNKDDWGQATIGTATAGKIGKVGTSYQVTRNKIAATLGSVPEVMNTGEMTVSFWVNSNRTDLNTEQNVFTIGGTKLRIMMKGNGTAQYGGGIYATTRNDGSTYGLHQNNGSTKTSSPAASINTWYHMVMTLEYGSNGKIVANGYQNNVHTGGRTTATGCTLTTTDLTGSAVTVGYTSNGLAGFVDELRIYNRILSVDEIAELYNRDYAAVYRNPTAEWSFTDGSIEDAVGTHEWSETTGKAVTANALGFANEGIKISQDTTEDSSARVMQIAVPDTFAGTKTLTLNTWVRRDYDTGSQQGIFYVHTAGDTSYGIVRTYLHDNKIKSEAPNGTGWQRALATAGVALDPEVDEWHMVTSTVQIALNANGGTNYTYNTYFDGELVSDREFVGGAGIGTNTAHAALKNGIPAGSIIYIGGGPSTAWNFRGAFDNVAIWNSVLSAEDVAKLYATQKQARPTATDSEITLVNGLALGTDNIAAFATTGIAESTNTYEAAATVGNTFKNEYIVIENIPTGLFVSKVVTGGDVTTVTFDGALTTAAKDDKTMSLYFMPYGTYNANSNAQDVTVKTGYELESTGSIAADTGVYTATVTNNSYDDTTTVDVVVAVYDSSKRMKDVYLSKDITTTAGSAFDVTTDALQYEDGDTVRMFIFESISNIKPVNALVK